MTDTARPVGRPAIDPGGDTVRRTIRMSAIDAGRLASIASRLGVTEAEAMRWALRNAPLPRRKR